MHKNVRYNLRQSNKMYNLYNVWCILTCQNSFLAVISMNSISGPTGPINGNHVLIQLFRQLWIHFIEFQFTLFIYFHFVHCRFQELAFPFKYLFSKVLFTI